nr:MULTISPECIES: NosD domain-containing protein [unclassified Actinomyces]
MHFDDDGTTADPENSYVNGKTGIYVEDPNDSFKVTGMGLVYLEHALTVCKADALSIHDCFIAECGSCIELLGWGQASKVTDNLIGAGPAGHSIYAENHGGLLIASNNVFPRGSSSVHLHGVTRSSVTSNRLHSFYPGMVVLDGSSSENLIGSNHLLRDHEPWTPFLDIDNGRDDDEGLVRLEGSDNSVIANHLSLAVDSARVRPAGRRPVAIRVVSGSGNYVANNHVVARDTSAEASDSCFEAQVGAMLTTDASQRLDTTTVLVEDSATMTTVVDSGTEGQVVLDRSVNAFRATPEIGAR